MFTGKRLLVVATSLTLVLSVASRASCDWPPEGVPLCPPGVCQPGGLLVVPDAVGGAFVIWGENRNGNADVYAQRVTAAGELAPGWPAAGLPVSIQTAHQLLSSAVPDGSGGILVAWFDYRNTGTGGTAIDVYAQRILADGSLAPGWPVDGAPVTRRAGTQYFPVVIADGVGGAFFTWDDGTVRDIYAQHLAADGQPAAGWPVDGLPICVFAGVQGFPQLIPDGANGAILAWGDLRNGIQEAYAQRVHPDGAIHPGWAPNGVRIVQNRAFRTLVPDGAGGGYLAGATLGTTTDAFYYLQRFSGAGATAPGWPADGAAVCLQPRERGGLRMVPDDLGGALLTWSDYRFDVTGCADEIYLHRFRPDGTRAPGFPVDGLRVTDYCGFDSEPELAADGAGGAYLCWTRYTGESHIAVQRITGAGTVAPGWPTGGLDLPGRGDYPAIAPDGMGGAIVAWQATDGTGIVRALRLGSAGPVPVQLALAGVEAEPGRVRLTWYAAEGAGLAATVERRTAGSEWQPLASLTADGTGQIAFEDRDVAPGGRYGYRLRYLDDGATRTSEETWVSVPEHVLALQGLTPNPSFGAAVVTFTLADGAPATLALFDVGGRQVRSREVGSLGAGVHRLDLPAGDRLPAGVYHLRLTQGARQLTRRAVVMR